MKKLNLFLFCVLLFYSPAKAQFKGLHSYYEEPQLRDQAKAMRIKTVSELGARTTYTYFGGSYTFDTLGRVIEVYTSSGNRIKTEYDKRGLILKSTHYDEKDSSKIAYWISTEYDAKGRALKVENGNYRDGQLMVTKKSETKVFTEANGTIRTETNKEYGGTVYGRDSVSGIYEFNISYKFKAKDIDEKGRQNGEKVLTREYFKDNCYYDDEIEYKVHGRLEIPQKIESRYHQTDAKGRLLEYGEIDYEEAFTSYFEKHPEDFNMYSLPPLFIKEILSGKIRGEKKPSVKCTYDAKGRLIEKYHYGEVYTFKYNEKGQVIEQIGRGSSNTTDVLYYNEKGLVIKMISTYYNINESPPKKETSEATLIYTYY